MDLLVPAPVCVIVSRQGVARYRADLPLRHNDEEALVQRDKPVVHRRHLFALAGQPELVSDQPVVFLVAYLRQGPTRHISEPDALSLTLRLPIEQTR